MRLTPKNNRYKGQGDCPIAGSLLHEPRREGRWNREGITKKMMAGGTS